ncbi:MAG: fumarylacetoacetate hydrolase family protein, partial [Pseudomonadota bacterium]
MGTSVVKFVAASGDAAWGILDDGAIYPLRHHYPHHGTLLEHFFNDRADFDATRDPQAISGEVTFLPPISQPTQLFAQGLNYGDHREESGLDEAADDNLIFAKPASTITGPNDNIVKPQHVELLDYEIELGLVLKRAISTQINVTDATLSDYVGALVLCNDVSARDDMFGAP